MAHVLAQDLRNAVLQAAMSGKLTDQSSEDSSVIELLRQISKDRDFRVSKKEVKKDKRLSDMNISDPHFDIPDNWEWTVLGAILYKLTDGTHKTPKYTTSGIKFVSVKDMSTGVLCLDNTKFISEEEHNELFARCNPQRGDIILSKVGTTGVPAIVNTDEAFSLFVSVALLKFNDKLINRNFLYYLLKSPDVQQQAAENTRGIGNKNWVLDAISVTEIPLPPIEEQARIVARVDELMEKIDEYEKIEKELTELQKAFPGNMKDAILQAAMQGKLTEQLSSDTDIRKYYEMVLSEEKIVSKKEKEVSFTGEEPFDIPSNWMWVKLNDLVGKEIRRGKSPKYAKDGKAMAFAQKCNSKYTGIRLDLALCLDDNSLSRYADHDKLQDLDVVINSTGGGTLGRIGLYKAEYNVDNKAYYPDSHVTVIRAKKCVSSLYIFRCLQYYSPYLETLGEGSTNQTELKPDVLKGLYIPLPPLEEQQRIVDKLDQLLPLCEQLERMAA